MLRNHFFVSEEILWLNCYIKYYKNVKKLLKFLLGFIIIYYRLKYRG